MTQKKLNQLKSKLGHIRTVSLPRAQRETRQHGENGDFSENAEYQIAKGRLRGLLRAVDELNYQINNAIVIDPAGQNDTVHIGHTVTLETGGHEFRFTILGPTEANPAAGIISYKSPIGEVLLNHRVGDTVRVETGDRTVEYAIKKIA